MFRVCNTTRMEANSVSNVLFTKYGKKWHFITPDYAFGHTLYDACTDDLKKLGGTVTGNELTPLGTTDFSAYLIKAQAANPDVLILLVQGSRHDQLPQAGGAVRPQQADPRRRHAAGAGIAGGAAARSARRHLDVRMVLEAAGRAGVEEFVADIRKVNNGKVPTARHWFGYTSAMTFALVANAGRRRLDAVKLAQGAGGFRAA